MNPLPPLGLFGCLLIAPPVHSGLPPSPGICLEPALRAALAAPRSPDQAPATTGESLVTVGRYFLGRPFQPGTLDQGNPTERLVCRQDAFDCQTYVETCLALLRARRSADPSAYPRALEQLRYRGGWRDGYASRLHYFTEWILDNANRGEVRDVTRELGGIPDPRPIHYMTDHAESYPALADPTVAQAIRRSEERLTLRRRYVIPRIRLRVALARMRTGDIIGFAAAAPGLDVAHVGLACRGTDGTLHLLHVSASAGKVVLSAEPLTDYVRARPWIRGLVVARPL